MSHRAFMKSVREFQDPQRRRYVLTPFPASRDLDRGGWDYKLNFWASLLPRYLAHRHCMSATGREIARCLRYDMRSVALVLQELYSRGEAVPFGEYSGSERRPLAARLVFWRRSISLQRCLCPSTRWVFPRLVDGFSTRVAEALRRDSALTVFTPAEVARAAGALGLAPWMEGKTWNLCCVEARGRDLLVKRGADGAIEGYAVEKARR